MRILRAADHKVMPWKNGLGSTTEILVSPEGAGLDDFFSRVSMAQVGNDGAFSAFADIDRTLLVLAGHGMVLDVAGHPPATLTKDSAPYTFPGDAPTAATLIDGPIIDLNIMVRRGLVRARVRRVKLMAPKSFSASAIHLLFFEAGTATIRSEAGVETLTAHDAVLLDKNDAPLTIAPGEPTTLVAIELDAEAPHIH